MCCKNIPETAWCWTKQPAWVTMTTPGTCLQGQAPMTNRMHYWCKAQHSMVRNVKDMSCLRPTILLRNKYMWLALTRCLLLRFVGAHRWKCWTLLGPEPIYSDSFLSHSGSKNSFETWQWSQSVLVCPFSPSMSCCLFRRIKKKKVSCKQEPGEVLF